MIEGLKRVFSAGSPVRPHEQCVLDAIGSGAGPAAATLLRRQLELVNKIQRFAAGKEVNFYRIVGGKPEWPSECRFPYTAEQSLLGRVVLRRAGGDGSLEGEAWLVRGRLFSLIFRQPPQNVIVPHLEARKIVIASVEVFFDPMHPPPIANEIEPAESHLGWEGPSTRVGVRLKTALPEDYAGLLRHMPQECDTGVSLFAVRDIRQLVWPDATYHLLAEIAGLGALGVKDGTETGEVYLIRYEENDVRPVGSSLRRAIIASGRDS